MNTRRKELTIDVPLPIEAFEEVIAPLKEGDTMGLTRDAAGKLIPTSTTGSVNKYDYTVLRGSVNDLFFHLESRDAAPATKLSTKPPAEVLQVGEEDCYEVEEILESRKARKGTEYLIKWRGWDSSTNTWQKERDIHSALVEAFEGKPAP